MLSGLYNVMFEVANFVLLLALFAVVTSYEPLRVQESLTSSKAAGLSGSVHFLNIFSSEMTCSIHCTRSNLSPV